MADLDEGTSAERYTAIHPGPAVVSGPPIALPSQQVPLFNREFSWIEFNRRVLHEASDPSVPLLERLKFLSITAGNLDEFLMVRVGAIRELIAGGVQERSPDGLTPRQQLKGIRERVKSLMREMYETLARLRKEMREVGIRIEDFSALSKKEQASLRGYFERHIAPVLTPLAVDPGHPFPFLASGALTLGAVLESNRGERHVAFLKVPPLLPRFIRIPEGGNRFVGVGNLISVHLGQFFPGLTVRSVVPCRVIRNADILLQEDEVEDLLKSVELELRRRERREVIWVEVHEGENQDVLSVLLSETNTSIEDVFVVPDLLKLSDLMSLYGEIRDASLKDPPFNPRIPPQLASSEDIFSIIRREDLLLHRPYDSFTPVIEFVQTAVDDPDVIAIKQTLYRTDRESPIVSALARAAEKGKQVVAIVELQARFDEMKNIAWARRLEESGVQVVYGLVGIKTHSKTCVVIRREAGQLRRYVHLSTGNYNAATAKLYTDLDLFTAEDGFGDDALQFMNVLTAYSITSIQEILEKHGPPLHWKRFVAAPMDYHDWALRMIQREIGHARAGRPAQIIAKMNALVDPAVIEALYEASRAGVKIELIVRGICCLVPGLERLSENIRVVSIVDRFLEHTRIFLFRNGGETEIYLSSGDWMPRNFFRRMELAYPILSPRLRLRLEEQILQTCLADNVKAWKLQSDGTYRKRSGEPAVRSQERFIEIARSEAVRVGPYEEGTAKAAAYRRKAKRHKKKDKGRH